MKIPPPSDVHFKYFTHVMPLFLKMILPVRWRVLACVPSALPKLSWKVLFTISTF